MGNRLSNENHDRTAEYAYDLTYRLTEAHYNTPGFSTNDSHSKGKGKGKGKSAGNANAIANQTEIYSYDPVGNRLASQKNNTYSYNAANQLVTENGTTYTYDKNGSLIQKAGSDEFASYFYDYENRLIKAERTEGTSVIVANYKYDPFGRRIEKKVIENGSTTTTRFFYDNEDILFEYDENGSIGNRYVHGPGIDEPLALIQRKGNYYYHADGLGSIVAITDESAKVVQDYDYYYFGELKNQKNRIKQPYKYTGREWDKETGLYFYRARYYDPEIGRFTQKDPIGFAGGINLFGYVGQNSINWIDPYGLDSIGPIWNTPGIGPNPAASYNQGSIQITGPFCPNCGTGSGASFIPDAFFGASFTDACQQHDRCYEDCNQTKFSCDEQLLLDLRQACGEPLSLSCMATAQLYYIMTTATQTAQDAFDQAQKP